jgi:hypothetical protein
MLDRCLTDINDTNHDNKLDEVDASVVNESAEQAESKLHEWMNIYESFLKKKEFVKGPDTAAVFAFANLDVPPSL